MARPIWSGTLSFGLLNIPVSLMSGERRTDISFRMLDARDNTPIRYERVNAETGEEVPWKDIVKAFEYDKGSYVVLAEEDIRAAAPHSRDAIEVESFVDIDAIGPQYFEKPYVLVPARKAEKGYVLLREALAKTRKIGIARVVIRTREHLCAVLPQDRALLLVMMRFPQELVDSEDYALPEASSSGYRISDKEREFSEQLINTMATPWKPEDYNDVFRQRLHDVIQQRMKAKGVVEREPNEPALEENASTNVVDFMSLLKQSISNNARTPAAGKAAAKAPSAKRAPKVVSKEKPGAPPKTSARKKSTAAATPHVRKSTTTAATKPSRRASKG